MKTTWPTLLVLLLVAAPAALQAQDLHYTNTDGGVYTYNTNADGSVNIDAYSGPPWAVTIPTNFIIPTTSNSLTVESIGTNAFYGETNLTNVTIPGSVTSIGAAAFEACSNLTSVTIPGSVTNIGIFAFYVCAALTNATISDGVINIGEEAFSGTALTSVNIPASVTNLAQDAFEFCYSLTAITVDPLNPAYGSLNGVLSDKSQGTLIEYPGGRRGSYTIAAGVTNIGEDAFTFCSNLTRVTIPGGVTTIGTTAFANCVDLTSVMIAGSVTAIGNSAFAACIELTNVFFTGNAPPVSSDVFEFDVNTTTYYLPGTTGWSYTYWGYPLSGPPAVLWDPFIEGSGSSFGISNHQFGFNITGTANIPIVIEAGTNLANRVWTPLQSLTLTNGLFYFSEPLQTNNSGRYYRISSP
jgi:archaellum component FlaG (FlaF/FlaG flagellin family)